MPTVHGFDVASFRILEAIEDSHYWFRARNDVIAAAVRGVVAPLASGYHVLEVGCGTGNVLRVLEQTCGRGHVFGLELFEEGAAIARQRFQRR